jgi:hypothetical protein
LFLVTQLKELGFLNKRKRVDELILYINGLAAPEELNPKLEEGKLFLDQGLNSFQHGKYPHILQLVLIGMAMRNR